MANRPEQLRLSPDERADLVAYVDGELADARSRVITTKLTMSATARREVEMLRKTWELLDHLPLPEVPEEFASKNDIPRLQGGAGGARMGADCLGVVSTGGAGSRLSLDRGRQLGTWVLAGAMGLAGPNPTIG